MVQTCNEKVDGDGCAKSDKERRLKWYRHVMRRLVVMDVPGETRKGG